MLKTCIYMKQFFDNLSFFGIFAEIKQFFCLHIDVVENFSYVLARSVLHIMA